MPPLTRPVGPVVPASPGTRQRGIQHHDGRPDPPGRRRARAARGPPGAGGSPRHPADHVHLARRRTHAGGGPQWRGTAGDDRRGRVERGGVARSRGGRIRPPLRPGDWPGTAHLALQEGRGRRRPRVRLPSHRHRFLVARYPAQRTGASLHRDPRRPAGHASSRGAIHGLRTVAGRRVSGAPG